MENLNKVTAADTARGLLKISSLAVIIFQQKELQRRGQQRQLRPDEIVIRRNETPLAFSRSRNYRSS